MGLALPTMKDQVPVAWKDEYDITSREYDGV